MVEVAGDVLVAVTPEAAFALATDPARMTEWQHGLREIERCDTGPVEVGSRLRGRWAVAGATTPFTSEVIVWEPPHRCAFRLRARGLTARLEQRFQPHERGCRVTASLTIDLPRALRPGPISSRVRREVARVLADDLARLRALVEQ